MKISLAIINDNASPYLRKYFESLGAAAKKLDIIFVDNASKDDSIQLVKKFGVQKIVRFETRQSSRAVLYNAARDKADHPLILFTHSDILFSEGFFDVLAASLAETPDIAFMNFRSAYVDKITSGYTRLHWDYQGAPPYAYESVWGIPSRSFANSLTCSTECFLVDTQVCTRMDEQYCSDLVVHAAMTSLLLLGARVEYNEKTAIEHYFLELHDEIKACEEDMRMFTQGESALLLDKNRKESLARENKPAAAFEKHEAVRPAYEQAQRFVNEGNTQAAIRALLELLALCPDHGEAHHTLGKLYYSQTDKIRALMHYERAVALDPQNIGALRSLADMYYVDMGRVDDAQMLYCRILTIKPDEVEALQILANICVSLKQLQVAEILFAKMLYQAPQNNDARNTIKAINKFRRTNNAPEPPEQWYRQSVILANAGLHNEAIALLQEILKSHPQFALAHNDLGVLYSNNNDAVKAREHYEHAVELAPSNLTFKKNLADFTLVVLGRPDEAVTMYSKLLEQAPEDEEIRLALDVARSRQDLFDSASFSPEKQMIETALLHTVDCVPYNYTNENYYKGVAKSGPACVIVANIGNAKRILKLGKLASFPDGTNRILTGIKPQGQLLYVFCNGDTFDPERVGYPHAFSVQEVPAKDMNSLQRDAAARAPREKSGHGDIQETMRFFCTQPFKNFDIQLSGDVFFCCPVFVNFYKIGNIYADNINDIWNGEKAKRFRYSICKGKFEYCNSQYCHLLSEALKAGTKYENACIKDRAYFSSWVADMDDCRLDYLPEEITLQLDRSCNLSCKSCRSRHYVMTAEESERLYGVFMNKVRPLLLHCTMLHLQPSGEFLTSAALLRFMQTLKQEEFPRLKYGFITNGQLFSEKSWNDLNGFNAIPVEYITISIDASEKETYETLRLNGKWEVLLQNLDFIRSLRKRKAIQWMGFNFLVQKGNYRQIESFADFASAYEVDEVFFQRINFELDMAYSKTEKEDIDVCNKNNPHYAEVVAAFQRLGLKKYDFQIHNNCI